MVQRLRQARIDDNDGAYLLGFEQGHDCPVMETAVCTKQAPLVAPRFSSVE